MTFNINTAINQNSKSFLNLQRQKYMQSRNENSFANSSVIWNGSFNGNVDSINNSEKDEYSDPLLKGRYVV